LKIQSPSKRFVSSSLTAASEAPSHAPEVASSLTAVPAELFDGGEIVILAIKPSMWRPVFDSAAWLVSCGLLAIMLIALGRTMPGLSLATSAQILLLIASARLAFAIMRWIPTWYVLTNRRVLQIQGVRAPRVSGCLLKEVQNTYVHYTVSDRMARLGTIAFVTNRRDEVSQVWQSIHDPEEVHAKIRRAIENALG
jgi:hypothetical protein